MKVGCSINLAENTATATGNGPCETVDTTMQLVPNVGTISEAKIKLHHSLLFGQIQKKGISLLL